MEIKIIHDMPIAEYHARPEISSSILSKMARSPLHARAYIDGERKGPTAAMLVGTAVHTAVLEPRRFSAEYAVFQGDRRTKEGKARYDEIKESGATIISAADNEIITSMTTAISQHPMAEMLLSDGIHEASVFWTDKHTGLNCRARPDSWSRNRELIVDLKTCEDASPSGFARSVANYRYHLQAAHYSAGTGCTRFIFLAIEKQPPFAIAAYELDADAFRAGMELRSRLLAMYASCQEFCIWPGYSDDIMSLSLPKWAMFTELEV